MEIPRQGELNLFNNTEDAAGDNEFRIEGFWVDDTEYRAGSVGEFSGTFTKEPSGRIRGHMHDEVGQAVFEGGINRATLWFIKRYITDETDSLFVKAPSVPIRYDYTRDKEGWKGHYRFNERREHLGATECQIFNARGKTLGRLS